MNPTITAHRSLNELEQIKPTHKLRRGKHDANAVQCGGCGYRLGIIAFRDDDKVPAIILAHGYSRHRDRPTLFYQTKRMRERYEFLRREASRGDTKSQRMIEIGNFHLGKRAPGEMLRSITLDDLSSVVVECVRCGARNGSKV